MKLKVLTYDEWCPVRRNSTPRAIDTPSTNWLHVGAAGQPWHLDTAIGHARYHTHTKGWAMLGYSACVVLDPEPMLLLGRVLQRGAHTVGYNENGAGICVPGRVTPIPQALVEALAEALRIGADRGWWPLRFTGGHRDVAAKPCPGDPLYHAIPDINQLAAQASPSQEEEGEVRLTKGDAGKYVDRTRIRIRQYFGTDTVAASGPFDQTLERHVGEMQKRENLLGEGGAEFGVVDSLTYTELVHGAHGEQAH